MLCFEKNSVKMSRRGYQAAIETSDLLIDMSDLLGLYMDGGRTSQLLQGINKAGGR